MQTITAGEQPVHPISERSKIMLRHYTAETIASNYRRKKKRKQPDWRNALLRRKYDSEVEFAPGDDRGIVIEV